MCDLISNPNRSGFPSCYGVHEKMSKLLSYSTLVLAAISTIFIATGIANAHLIVDGGFEAGASFSDGVNLSNGDTNLSTWSISGGNGSGAVTWIRNNPTGAPFLTSSEGNYFLNLTRPDSSGWSTLTQSISTVSGATYDLTFDIGASHHRAGAASVSALAGGTSQTYSISTSQESAWASKLLEFTATSSTTVISFIGTSPGSTEYTRLDNVSVILISTPGPEPSTFALLSRGGIGLAIGAYRRRKVAA